jgi:hypothetical protein
MLATPLSGTSSARYRVGCDPPVQSRTGPRDVVVADLAERCRRGDEGVPLPAEEPAHRPDGLEPWDWSFGTPDRKRMRSTEQHPKRTQPRECTTHAKGSLERRVLGAWARSAKAVAVMVINEFLREVKSGHATLSLRSAVDGPVAGAASADSFLRRLVRAFSCLAVLLRRRAARAAGSTL